MILLATGSFTGGVIVGFLASRHWYLREIGAHRGRYPYRG